MRTVNVFDSEGKMLTTISSNRAQYFLRKHFALILSGNPDYLVSIILNVPAYLVEEKLKNGGMYRD